MPPRSEEELDAVTLHNQALMNMEAEPSKGFQKLQFLLQQNPFPPETFGNLLLLYVKYEVSSSLVLKQSTMGSIEICFQIVRDEIISALVLKQLTMRSVKRFQAVKDEIILALVVKQSSLRSKHWFSNKVEISLALILKQSTLR